MLRIFAAGLIAAFASTAAAEECNFYAARDYPAIKLIEDGKTVTVKWEGYSETYEKTITKPFGVLMEGAFDPKDKNAATHIFTRTKVGGKGAIIFDSLIFYPACEDPH